MEKTEKESYRKAGRIASQVVSFAREFVKPEMKLIEIAEKIEGKIIELGGEIAFPVNLSLNEIAAHYTPSANDETIAEGILKIDLGVCIEGYIADTAFSLDLTEDKRFSEMIGLNEKVLSEALGVIKPCMKVNEIGNTIHKKVEDYNNENKTRFSIIKNLSGHSLEKNMIHAGLNIPNYRHNSECELKEVAIAIEPFLTLGAGEVIDGKKSEIYMLQAEGQVRDSDARKLLKFIKENYITRPFCKRWLEKKGFAKIGFSLDLMARQGILHNFPVLVEKTRMPVSQAEHTVLISDKVEVTSL